MTAVVVALSNPDYFVEELPGAGLTGEKISADQVRVLVPDGSDPDDIRWELLEYSDRFQILGITTETDPKPWVSSTGFRTAVQAAHPVHGLSTYSPREGITE
jgi:hypothetical protein